ncbi:lysozyme [Bartonella sp. DGB1]|uniref:lysozyme n=1 Tax=Bartonella sp. DGB1 TaxID=3239807 RepID=UPI0035238662
MRKVNNTAFELIKNFEGLRLEAYKDIAGVWTIGYGHTSIIGGLEVKEGLKITEQQALELLNKDVAKIAASVEKYVKVPLNDNQFAALVSFVYNIGINAFKTSTLLSKLNAGEYAQIPFQLSRWIYASRKKLTGLVKRRKAEADLWETDNIKLIGTIKNYSTKEIA